MSPLKHSTNVAARMGRWSARHRKIAIWGWLAFVIASFVVGMAVGLRTIDESDYNVGEARRGDHIIRDGGFAVDEQSEFVLVESKTANATDPAVSRGRERGSRVSEPVPAGHERPVAVRGRQRGADLEGRARGTDPVHAQRLLRGELPLHRLDHRGDGEGPGRESRTTTSARPDRHRPGRRSRSCSPRSSQRQGSSPSRSR